MNCTDDSDRGDPGHDALLVHELEEKRQELHVAKMTIKTLTANLGDLEYENTELKVALSEAKDERNTKHADEAQKNVISANRQLIADLQQALEEAQASKREAQNDVFKLEEEVKFLQLAGKSVVSFDNEEDRIVELLNQVEQLEEEKNFFKNKSLEANQELERKQREIVDLRHEIEEAEEEMESLKCHFSSQHDVNERLREERENLQVQLESEAGGVDIHRKGNSLFSEVEDRRVAAERKVVKVEESLSDMKEKYTKEQQENTRLKQKILLLRQASRKGHDDKVVRDLQNQLMNSRKEVVRLTEQLRKKPALTSTRNTDLENRIPPVNGVISTSAKQLIDNLKGILSLKVKEVERAQAEASEKHMQILNTDLLLTQATNEVTNLKYELDAAKVNSSHLSMQLQEMQRKYEPEQYLSPQKMDKKFSKGQPCLSTVTVPERNSRSGTTPTATGEPTDTNTHSKKSVPLSSSADSKSICDKENDVSDIITRILGSSSNTDAAPGKSVHMAEEVSIISSEGESTVPLAEDGKGRKLKKHGGGSATGKYESVTYAQPSCNSQPSECKQQ